MIVSLLYLLGGCVLAFIFIKFVGFGIAAIGFYADGSYEGQKYFRFFSGLVHKAVNLKTKFGLQIVQAVARVALVGALLLSLYLANLAYDSFISAIVGVYATFVVAVFILPFAIETKLEKWIRAELPLTRETYRLKNY